MRKFIWLGGTVLVLVCFFLKAALEPTITNQLAAAARPDLEPLQASYRAESLKKLAFGYDSFLSSLIWIRLLQQAKTTPLKKNALSWEYSELDSITTLDPNFEIAYSYGAIYVSFFRRDKKGGLRLLQKWVQHRPNYWKAHHFLGMHYFVELQDTSRAATHILRASKLPAAPPYLASLGVGLMGESGSLEFALRSALEIFDLTVNEQAQIRIAHRIRSLRWALEKRKWEQALTAFKIKNPTTLPSSLGELTPFIVEDFNRQIASSVQLEMQSETLKSLLSEKFSFKLNSKRSGVESTDPKAEQEFSNIGVYSPEG